MTIKDILAICKYISYRYISYHLQVSYRKKETFLACLKPRTALCEHKQPRDWIWFTTYWFLNSFTCDLYKIFPKVNAEDCQGICGRKYRDLLVFWQKDYWGTAEVNDAFKLLSRQKDCWWSCSWNLNTA